MGMYDTFHGNKLYKCPGCSELLGKSGWQTKALENVLWEYRIGDSIVEDSIPQIRSSEYEVLCYDFCGKCQKLYYQYATVKNGKYIGLDGNLFR